MRVDEREEMIGRDVENRNCVIISGQFFRQQLSEPITTAPGSNSLNVIFLEKRMAFFRCKIVLPLRFMKTFHMYQHPTSF
jgi:hypothetical protein